MGEVIGSVTRKSGKCQQGRKRSCRPFYPGRLEQQQALESTGERKRKESGGQNHARAGAKGLAKTAIRKRAACPGPLRRQGGTWDDALNSKRTRFPFQNKKREKDRLEKKSPVGSNRSAAQSAKLGACQPLKRDPRRSGKKKTRLWHRCRTGPVRGSRRLRTQTLSQTP